MTQEETQTDKLQRIVEWTPAFDKRDPNPAKNYGVQGVELRFVLKGPKGATQFVVYTNWMLPSAREPWDKLVTAHLLQPMPADVGYHARVPQYEGQETISQACPYLDDAPCYCDSSRLAAEPLFDEFCSRGEEAVWEALEARYLELIGPGTP